MPDASQVGLALEPKSRVEVALVDLKSELRTDSRAAAGDMTRTLGEPGLLRAAGAGRGFVGW